MTSNLANPLLDTGEIPEVSASFTLTGADFDPNEITAALGVVPTATWRLGDRIGRSRIRRQHNGWVLRIGPELRYDWDQQLRQLLDRLDPVSDQLRSLIQNLQLDPEIACVAYIHDVTPSFHLTLDDFERIRRLSAEVDLDLIRCEVTETSDDDQPPDRRQARGSYPATTSRTEDQSAKPGLEDAILHISTTSPRLAVIEVARLVEMRMRASGPEPEPTGSFLDLVRILERSDRWSSAASHFVRTLWTLRSEALHSRDFEPTYEQARELARRAETVLSALEQY